MQVSLHLNYQFPLYGFDFTDAWKWSILKTDEKNVLILLNEVSALDNDQFMQVLLYSVSWLFANTLA